MSETNYSKQPRRRRTQLNAAQYAGQQTLDDSIPLVRTEEDAPMQPNQQLNPAWANPPVMRMSTVNPANPVNQANPTNPARQNANPPMQPMNPVRPQTQTMPPVQTTRPQPINQANQPVNQQGNPYAQNGQMRGFRGVQGTPVQPQQGWNSGVQPLDTAHQMEQFPWGKNPNTGRNQPIRGAQPMPNQPTRQQNPPYQQQNYGGWQQPAYPANYPQYPANGGNGGGNNHPPTGFGGFNPEHREPKNEPVHRKQPGGKKLLKRIVFCACAVAVVCGLVAAGSAISKSVQEQNAREALVASVTAYDDKYVPNVYVDGIDLGGMTRAEAKEAVTAHANQQRDAWKVRLTYAGQLVKEITSADLNMTVDVQEALDLAWEQGHTEGDVDARKAAMDALAENPYEGYSATPSGDNVVIDNILLNIAQQAYIAPVDAQIYFDASNFNNPLTIQAETVGRYMDTTEAKTQVYQMMSSLESGEVALTTRELQPTTTKAMLEPKIQLRATAYTPISTTSTEERNLNIEVSCARINGKMFASGETFSFNDIVGKRTKANGFYQAIEYAYGDQRMGYGGGVCQTSTTVYLAAAQANMTILKRTPHSDAVGYTDYGKDATVSDNRIDFQFRNDTGSTIFIVATVTKDSRYDKSHKVCVVSIYGETLGTGVKYDLVTETVQVLPAPTEPEYRKDTNHTYATYVDQEYVYRTAHDGYVVESYLVKYVNGAETEKKLMYTDTYKAKGEIIYVGTVERTEEVQ